LNYEYTYDKMDNITDKSSEHGDYQFTYDVLYRLMTADNPILSDEAFTYDQVGNRLTASGVTDEWSYNANNELQGYDDVSYEYDENGSITQKTDNGVITKFFYNVEGRLERVEDGSSNIIAEYYYDPFGRRLWKEVSGSTTFFQYADEGLVAEYDETGTEIKTYGYKPGSTWTTDPLFMKEGTEYYFYHNDHLGTPQKLTAMNGAVVWGAQYEAFGKANVDGGSTVVNNLRFPGQYYDQETGLHYNFHRYYDPVSGRYFRVDPIGLDGGVNVFAYVYNNPKNNIDPLGLEPVGPIFGPGGLKRSGPEENFDCPEDDTCKTSYLDCLEKCVSFLNPWWTVPAGGAIGAAGYASSGSASVGLAFTGAALVGWSIGTSVGCAIACDIDHCSYDFY
jgi:RHS repeat-associated protein